MNGARTKRVIIDEVIEMTTENETCLSLLKQHCQGYEKNSEKCFPVLRLNTIAACRRARQLENPAIGQGSDMPDLIDRLCRLTDLPLEEARKRLIRQELTPEQADLELGYFRRSLNCLGQTALAMTTLGKQQKKLVNSMAGNIEKPFAFARGGSRPRSGRQSCQRFPATGKPSWRLLHISKPLKVISARSLDDRKIRKFWHASIRQLLR